MVERLYDSFHPRLCFKPLDLYTQFLQAASQSTDVLPYSRTFLFASAGVISGSEIATVQVPRLCKLHTNLRSELL